jgi:hypothetical protein
MVLVRNVDYLKVTGGVGHGRGFESLSRGHNTMHYTTTDPITRNSKTRPSPRSAASPIVWATNPIV